MKAKITNPQRQRFLKSKLSSSKTWAVNGLMKIYEFQTQEEQRVGQTIQHNGVGFTGADSVILTSFAKQFLRKGYLSDKQMVILTKKMPKYWRQILSLSDPIKLDTMIQKNVITSVISGVVKPTISR